MSRLLPGKALDAEVADLWARRDSLSTSEWERLYQIVHAVLGNYRPQELAGLREDKEFYIQDFFVYKVMKVPAGKSVIDHAGALRTFYVNHLRDHLDKVKVQRKHVDQVRDEDDEDSSSTRDVENSSKDALKHGFDARPEDDIDESSEHDLVSHLAEHAISLEKAVALAQAFLERNEPWVPVYLAFHFCPDKNRSEALKTLAERLHISSYHYKATQLGINWAPGKAGNLGKPFAETVIGRWVNDELAIAIMPENRTAILAAFKVLCFEALNWGEAHQQEVMP